MIELCEDAGFNIIGVIDNILTRDYYGYPVLGTDNDAPAIYLQYPKCQIVITPDYPRLRKELVALYRSSGFSFATVIHPAATVSRFATIGEGAVVQRGVNVSANTIIGNFCKLNTGCNIMHDNVIGDYATIAPNAVLLGYVTIGDLSYVGANSTILPKISVGEQCTVGAGAVVTKSVQPNLVVAGVPAKILMK